MRSILVGAVSLLLAASLTAQGGGGGLRTLATGCQLEATMGPFPSVAIKAMADGDGVVILRRVGDTYSLTAQGVAMPADDPRWVDLHTYEIVCRTYLPA